jgi:outer membrane biosynthesis protein TonB
MRLPILIALSALGALVHAQEPQRGDSVVDEAPRLRSCRAPSFPASARTRGLKSGQVALEFVIDTTGHAESEGMRVVSFTDSSFIEPARTAVLGCSFVPGKIRRRPVRTRSAQTVTFAR